MRYIYMFLPSYFMHFSSSVVAMACFVLTYTSPIPFWTMAMLPFEIRFMSAINKK